MVTDNRQPEFLRETRILDKSVDVFAFIKENSLSHVEVHAKMAILTISQASVKKAPLVNFVENVQ